MTPRADYPMSEHLAWVQWWAFPWKDAHADWKGDEFPAIEALYHSGRLAPGNFNGIAACLPPEPQPTLLRLALATREQLNLALTLIHDTFNPLFDASLSPSHHLWCVRLSKAMPPDMLAPGTDPLQLLHRWVDPAIWQRLRLRFPRERVRAVEQQQGAIERASNRLNTLWQAVIWRVTTPASDSHG